MRTQPLRRSGFSLVETAIALGLLAFCLVALLGLLPTGLQSIQEMQRQAEAVRLLKLVATGLQAAHQAPDAQEWQMLGLKPDASVRWLPDGRLLPPVRGWMTASGMPVARPQDGEFSYIIELAPNDEAQPASYARAMLRIAWPATAIWKEERWTHAQGSEEALVLFRPR